MIAAVKGTRKAIILLNERIVYKEGISYRHPLVAFTAVQVNIPRQRESRVCIAFPAVDGFRQRFQLVCGGNRIVSSRFRSFGVGRAACRGRRRRQTAYQQENCQQHG